MNDSEEFNRLYSDVSDSISSALADIDSLNVEHKDGKREIGNITEKLRKIQGCFNQELRQLKTHAEWDVFTLAFFGETNAGKSTIIESLRILFNEKSRQALLQQNADDLELFAQALTKHLEHVREGLFTLYNEYADELAVVKQSTDQLKQLVRRETQERSLIASAEAEARTLIIQQEAKTRLEMQEQEIAHRQKLAEQEFSARLLAEQQEISQRLQIEKVYAASRFKIRLAFFSLGGILIGVTSAIFLLKLAGT